MHQAECFDGVPLTFGDERPVITRDEPVEVGTELAGGDPARLRGLPAIGRGVSGSTVETDPVRALLAKERRRRPARTVELPRLAVPDGHAPGRRSESGD